MQVSTEKNQVRFVLVELDYNDSKPVKHDGENHEILSSYQTRTATFVSENNFTIDQILSFDSYMAAYMMARLLWDVSNIYVGIAIWESREPDLIDSMYINWGETKNMEVKANREKMG